MAIEKVSSLYKNYIKFKCNKKIIFGIFSYLKKKNLLGFPKIFVRGKSKIGKKAGGGRP